MSTSDPTPGPLRPEHARRLEGEYTDKNGADPQAPEEVGTYVERDVVDTPTGPDDVGEYTDDDVETAHRPAPAEGEYTDRDE